MTSEPEKPDPGLPLADTGLSGSGPAGAKPARRLSRLFLIPLVNFVTIPICVVGGTLLFLELEAETKG